MGGASSGALARNPGDERPLLVTDEDRDRSPPRFDFGDNGERALFAESSWNDIFACAGGAPGGSGIVDFFVRAETDRLRRRRK